MILGVSPDPVSAQLKFAEKYGLPYRLLSDADHHAAEAYGVWVEKNNYGKTSMGIQRSTFVVGPDGVLNSAFPKVTSLEDHASIILAALQER